MQLGTFVLACLGSSGFMSLVSLIVQRHWAKKDAESNKQSDIDRKLDMLIHHEKVMTVDRLTHIGEEYVRDGEITVQNKLTYHKMYESAKTLGMNGDCKVILDAVDALPVV